MIEIVTAALTALSLATEPQGVERGYLSAYADGMMHHQVVYRQGAGQAPHNAYELYDTFIAVSDCSLIGDVWFLRPVDEDGRKGEWVRALVVDCAGDIPTVEWLETNRILAEVDWQTWQEWQPFRGKRGLGVEVVSG